MPKLACCRDPCGTCVYPCDPPPETERDLVYYFVPCEPYSGPPTCGFSVTVEVKPGGLPMHPAGASCSSLFVFCDDSAISFSGSLTYLCLYGDATHGQELQWSDVTCPTAAGYPYPVCNNNFPTQAVTEIGGPQFIGYCNASACAPPITPCTCAPKFLNSLAGGELVFYNVNDPLSQFYDPQPWTDVIEIERVCCWKIPPAYQWFTISGSGDIMGIGDQAPPPGPPVGHRCNVITQSASGQSMAQALRDFLGTDYKITVLTDEVYWAGGAYYELVFGGCAGKLMSCEEDGCGCKGRYLSDEWRVNYIDDCRAIVQARHAIAMSIGGISFGCGSNVQELEIPIGSGNYFCRCSGSTNGVGATMVATKAILITYGQNITGSSFAFDFDFNTDPNQCDGVPGNCSWCNMGGALPIVT